MGNTVFTVLLKKGDDMREIIAQKNKILGASIVASFLIAIISIISVHPVTLVISLAWFFFMLVNNYSYFFRDKDEVDELLRDCR